MAPALRMTVSSNPTETKYLVVANRCTALNQREATNFFGFSIPQLQFLLDYNIARELIEASWSSFLLLGIRLFLPPLPRPRRWL